MKAVRLPGLPGWPRPWIRPRSAGGLLRSSAWVAVAFLLLPVHAQNAQIPWYRASGGGGTSTQQALGISGSSGQTEAGILQGGGYRIEGGFWPGWLRMRTAGGTPSQFTLTPESGFAGSAVQAQGRVAPGATAVRLFWGTAQDNQGWSEVPVDSDGLFVFTATVPEGAQPGEYVASAVGLGLANPVVLTAPFEVLAKPPGGVSGSILALSGANLVPVPDAVIRVMDPSGKPVASGTSAGNGIYTITGLPPGSYTLFVSKDGQYFSESPIIVPPGQSSTTDVQAVVPNAVPAPAVVSHVGGIVLPHPLSAYSGSEPVLFTDSVSAKNSGLLALLPALPTAAGGLPIRLWAEVQFPTNPPQSERRVRFEIFDPQGKPLFDFYKNSTQPILSGHPVFGYNAYTTSLGLLLDLDGHSFPPGDLALRITPYIGNQAGSGKIYWIEVVELGTRWFRPWVKILPDPNTGRPLRVLSASGGLTYILNAELPAPDLLFEANIPLGITTLNNKITGKVPFQEIFDAAVGKGLRQSFAIPPELDLEVTLLGLEVYQTTLPYKARTLAGGALKYDFGFDKAGNSQPVNLGSLTIGPVTIYQNGPGIHCFNLCFVGCEVCGGYKIWVDLKAQVQANIASSIHPDLALEIDFVPSASGTLGGHLKAKAGIDIPGIGDIGCSANADVTGTVTLHLPFYYLSGTPPVVGFSAPCVSLQGDAGGKIGCVGLNLGAGGSIGPFYWPDNCLPAQSLGKHQDEDATAAGVPPSPAIAANANGQALAVWIQNEPQPAGDSLPFISFSRFDGSDWTPAARLAPDPASAGGPTVCWRGPQEAVALWAQNRRSPDQIAQDGEVEFAWQEILWSRWNGSNWSTPAGLTSDENLDAYPVVVHDPVNAQTIAVWIRRLDPPPTNPALNAFAAVYSLFNGTDWTTPRTIDEPLPSLDTVPTVAASPAGGAWAVFQRDQGGDLTTPADRALVISRWDGAQWSAPTLIPNLPAGVFAPSVTVDAADRPLVTFTIPPTVEAGAVGTGVGNRSRLGYAFLRASGWEVGTVHDPTYAEAPVARFQPDGQLSIAFRRFGGPGELLTGDTAMASADPSVSPLVWTVDDFTEDGQSNWQTAFDIDPVSGRHFLMSVKQPPIGRAFVDPGGMTQDNPRGAPVLYQAGGQPAIAAHRFEFQPDLAVLPTTVQFSDDHPARGQVVQIAAEARNLGLRALAGPVRVRFYRGTSSAGQLLGESLIQGGLQPGQRVLVNLDHTVDNVGLQNITAEIDSVNPSNDSNPANNTAGRLLGLLSPPSTVVAEVESRSGNVVVRWDTPDPKGGLTFDVFRASQPGGPFELVGTTTGLDFSDPLTRPGNLYFYQVVARDDVGTRSAPSASADTELTVRLRISRGGQDLLVAWPRRFDQFQLEEAPSISGPWTPVTAATAAVGFERQVGLPAVQSSRFYRVTERNPLSISSR